MTADEETDLRITDYEMAMQDIREGFQEALLIIATITALVWGCWVFA